MSLISDILFRKTSIPVLQRSLDASALRHRVIANNLANISTPNYRRKEVSFEEELGKATITSAIQGITTNPKHLPLGRKEVFQAEPVQFEPEDASDKSGINNVDIDQEMAELAKNQVYYTYAARLLTRNFNALRASIRGRAT